MPSLAAISRHRRKSAWRILALSLAMVAIIAPPGGAAADTQLPSLLVLNLELVDTSGEVTDQREAHRRRLAAIRRTLARELAARDLYTVVDPAPIQDEIDATRERQYLHACNGCEIRFAREIDADRVLTGHVRKISSLVMALWVDIKDARTGRPVVHETIDFRGDNDRAWQHAAVYLVRELEEMPPDQR